MYKTCFKQIFKQSIPFKSIWGEAQCLRCVMTSTRSQRLSSGVEQSPMDSLLIYLLLHWQLGQCSSLQSISSHCFKQVLLVYFLFLVHCWAQRVVMNISCHSRTRLPVWSKAEGEHFWGKLMRGFLWILCCSETQNICSCTGAATQSTKKQRL